jgi:hypothetical protein
MLGTTSDAPTVGHSQEREGFSPAFRFPAPSPALTVLRPASIPKSVNIYDSAYFDDAALRGPNRHILVDGLVTLNGLGALSDEALISVADSSLNNMVIWSYVEAGFSECAEAAVMPSGHLLSPLIADSLPLQSMARHWLNWHDLNPEVVPATVLTDIEAMPEIGSGTPESEQLAGRLPALYSRYQGRIAGHLNALCEVDDKGIANDLPMTFIAETWDAGAAPLMVGCGDMMGLNFGVRSRDFSSDYWKAVVQGLRLIGLCLRPMMTPDEMIDLSPVQMEEEADDVEAVIKLLKERNQQTDDEDAVHAALDEVEPFVIECFGSFQCALEGYEIAQDVKARWLAEEAALTVPQFADLVSKLPEPANDMDEAAAGWLASVASSLPESVSDSPLHRVRHMAHCEGTLDMLLPVFFEDDIAFADASIQPAYEVFMSDAEESSWSLGWDIPVALLEQFAKGIGIGNKLLAELDDCLPW